MNRSRNRFRRPDRRAHLNLEKLEDRIAPTVNLDGISLLGQARNADFLEILTTAVGLPGLGSFIGLLGEGSGSPLDGTRGAGWVPVKPGEPENLFKNVEGTLLAEDPHDSAIANGGQPSVTNTDLPFTHLSHDWKAFIQVDPGYEYLVSQYNPNPNGKFTNAMGDRTGMELEWEKDSFPDWVWPSVGDRVWANGAWIYDVAHVVNNVDGFPRFASEIHPPRAFATMRSEIMKLPGSNDVPIPVTSVDLYIHGDGGLAPTVETFGSAATLTLPLPYITNPIDHNFNPIDNKFQFDVMIPKPPNPSAALPKPIVDIEDGPGNTIGVAPSVSDAFKGTDNHWHVTVTIPLEGTGVSWSDVYARRIHIGWAVPPPAWLHPNQLHHFQITLQSMTVHDDLDNPDIIFQNPGELSNFWLNINKASGKEWIRLQDYTSTDMDDINDGDVINFDKPGATFDFYLGADDQIIGADDQITFYANGYDQDAFDYVFGVRGLPLNVLLAAYVAVVPLHDFDPAIGDPYVSAKQSYSFSDLCNKGAGGGIIVLSNPGSQFDLTFKVSIIPTTIWPPPRSIPPPAPPPGAGAFQHAIGSVDNAANVYGTATFNGFGPPLPQANFHWTPTNGTQTIATLPGPSYVDDAGNAYSINGTSVIQRSPNGATQAVGPIPIGTSIAGVSNNNALVYTLGLNGVGISVAQFFLVSFGGTPQVTQITPPPPPTGSTFSGFAYFTPVHRLFVVPGMVDDFGDVYASATFSNGITEAFRWTPSGGSQGLAALIGATGSTYIDDVSPDGHVLVNGYAPSSNITPILGLLSFGATPQVTMIPAPPLPESAPPTVPGSPYASLTGRLDNAGEVFGFAQYDPATVPNEGVVFRWTQGSCTLTLSSLVGAGSFAFLDDVAPNGNVLANDDKGNLFLIQEPTDLVAKSLSWHSSSTDGGGVDLTYDVKNSDLPQPANIALYWAHGTTFDPTNDIVAYQFNSQITVGSYTQHVTASQLADPPDGANGADSDLHLLLVVNANGVIVESDSANEGNNVAILAASPHDIVSISATGVGTPFIDATFVPAGGALTLAQAAKICGVDHFNWLQVITPPAPPPSWTYLVGPSPSATPSQLTPVNGPLYDPIVRPAGTQITYFISVPGVYSNPIPVTISADQYPPYLDEIPAEWQLGSIAGGAKDPFTFAFHDAPEMPTGDLSQSPYGSNPEFFFTKLVGIDSNHDVVPNALAGIPNTTILWSDNAIYNSGGIQSIAVTKPVPGFAPPVISGGVLSIQLLTTLLTPTINVSESDFTYDGQAHSASAAATGVNGAAVSGSFSFTYNGSANPPTNAGTYAVVATFTSSDPNYANATGSGSVTINPAPLTITADNQTKVYGDPLPSLTASYTGFVNGETPASLTVLPTLTTTATASSDVVPGGYPITASGAVDPNYAITYVSGTLTIIPANQTITWSNPADIIYGTALGNGQLNATVTVVGPAPAGALAYTPPAGTILGPGSGQVLSVTAAATNDYNSATANVTINVVYNFSGFLAPLSQNVSFGLGRTIPIKFQLFDVNGNLITALGAVTSLQGQALDANGNAVGSAFVLPSSGNTALRNDGTQYVFNWQMKGLTAGSYEILLSLNDGTTKTKTLQLTKTGGAAGMTTVAAGGTASAAAGTLLAGDVDVFVNDANGLFTAEELARINDAVASVDAIVSPYGVTITEVTDSSLANVTLDTGSTSAVGGFSSGVLGCTTDAGEITIIQGWNWYAGSDPSGIAAGQYDFQTVVTHELGHALGLGHSANAASVMFATLTTGTTNRALAVADLNVPDSDSSGACGLHAGSAPGTEFSFGVLYPSPQPVPWGTPTRGEGEGADRAMSDPQSALSAVLADWSSDTDFAGQASRLLGDQPSKMHLYRADGLTIDDQDEFWSTIGGTMASDESSA